MDNTLKTFVKIFFVIFVITIVISNVLNIIKILRRGRMLKSPRRFLLFTLSLGDILLALYSLLVHGLLLFKPTEDYYLITGCKVYFVAEMYALNFVPFVYAASLIVMCIELKKRKEISSNPNPFLMSVAITAIPWVSALVIILPLSLTGGLFVYGCGYNGHWKVTQATYIVSGILPATLACIVFFIFQRLHHNPIYDIYVDNMHAPVLLNLTQTQQGKNKMFTIDTTQSHDNQACNTQPTAPPTSTEATNYAQNKPQPAPAAQLSQQQPDSQQPQQLQPSSQYPVLMTSQEPFSGSQQPNNITEVASLVKNEQRAIGKVVIINCLLTLPYALFHVVYVFNGNRTYFLQEDVFDVIYFLTFGLLFVRSVVTPLIWMKSIY